MRKPTIFNSSEKELLITATQVSLQTAVNYPDQLERIQILANEVLVMLKSEWDHYYPVECVNYLERVVKDFLEPYSDKIKNLLDTPLSKILDQQQMEPIDLKLIDKCNAILGKLGRRKTKFNFVDVFERIHGSQKKVVENTPSNSFEWEPVLTNTTANALANGETILNKSNSLSFEVIPGESSVMPTTNKIPEENVVSAPSNLFIDLITEQRSYREVA